MRQATRHYRPSLWMLAAIIACTGWLGTWTGCEKEQTWQPPFDPAVCGAESYAWIDPARMGAVVSYELDTIFTMSRSAIEALVNTTDYADVLEVRYGVTVYRIRYETQDRGRRQEATAVVGIPEPEGTEVLPPAVPTVLCLHGTSGFMDDCAPSALGAVGALPVVVMACQGYLAVAPDYLGMAGFGGPSTMSHPYLVGEPTAIASWDSMRAAERLLSEVGSPVESDGRVVLWGGSQGGHAVFFTELYAPYYAGRYDVVAGVALIPPSDLAGQTEAWLRTTGPGSAAVAAATVGSARWYGYGDRLGEVLNVDPPVDISVELPRLMDTTCDISMEDLQVTDASDLFSADFIDQVSGNNWQGFETWRCLMEENSVNTTSVPRISTTPILVVLAENDELVAVEVERAAFDELCAKGYEMEFIECLGATHTQGAAWSLQEQFTWVADRLAGLPLEAPCQRGGPECCSSTDEGPCVTPP